MSEPSNLIKLFINICISGCKITFNNNWPEGLMPISLLHLPKTLIYLDTINKVFPKNNAADRRCKLSVQGINSTHNISFTLYHGFDVFNMISTRFLKAQIDSDINISIYDSIYSREYPQNQKSIDKMVHYLYTKSLEEPSTMQLDSYKKKLWDFMYNECFGSVGIFYLILCEKYLVSDVKKLIIDHVLTIDKWSNLGFYCR